MTFGLTDQLVSLEREEWLAYSAGDYSEAARLSALKASYTAMRQAQELKALSGRSGDTPPAARVTSSVTRNAPFPTFTPQGPRSYRKASEAKLIPHGTIEGYLIHGCECWKCARSRRGCDSIRALGVKNG